MADRLLRSRSSTRDEDSFNCVDNTNIDSTNTILQSEADTTVRANPAVESNVQKYEVTALDSNNANVSNITTVQLKELFATVMTAIQAESIKQTAAFQTEVVIDRNS
jgi:hypothetical protein